MTPEHDILDDLDLERSESLEFDALKQIILSLRPLSSDARKRVLSSVSSFLGIEVGSRVGQPPRAPSDNSPSARTSEGQRFSEDRTPSPKEFLFEKKPTTDVDRIACLAYYLTHYRDTPHFKTLDLSKLNTEAAQLKLSNAAHACDNAARAGLLVPAAKGAKQLSALGELYVQAFPDKLAAKEAIAHAKPRRKTRRSERESDAAGVDEQN